jgi:hypothetical protein
LFAAGVPDRLAHGIDVAGQGGFRDDAAAPDGFDQVVLAHDTRAVLHEVKQQVEDLRPDRDHLGPTGELPPIGVKHNVLELVSHVVP